MKQRPSILLFFLLFSLGTISMIPGNPVPETCSKSNEVNTGFLYDAEKKLLKISFEEEDMRLNDPEQLEAFRDENVYPFEEDFQLPEELCKELGSSAQLIIKKGNYPVTYNLGIYSVLIRL